MNFYKEVPVANTKTKEQLEREILEANAQAALLNLDQLQEENQKRVTTKLHKARVFAERQRNLKIASKTRTELFLRCNHRQGGPLNDPFEAPESNKSALNVAKMPDGFTKRVSCLICRGEMYTPHPYFMRKKPFPVGFHMPSGVVLEKAESASDAERRVRQYEADVKLFTKLLKMAKDKITPEAAQEMDCGTVHVLTNSETGEVVYPWRPCDASPVAIHAPLDANDAVAA